MTFDVVKLVIFGIGAGVFTSCGYFALFMTVGVINRFEQFSHTADREKWYEDCVILGVALGNIICLYDAVKILPNMFWCVFLLFTGCFSGCFLLSLAEAVKGIPVFVRRSRIRCGFTIIIFFLALGKGLGSLFYFVS